MHMVGGFLAEIGFMNLYLGSFVHITLKPVTYELTNRSKMTHNLGKFDKYLYPRTTVELEKHLTK